MAILRSLWYGSIARCFENGGPSLRGERGIKQRNQSPRVPCFERNCLGLASRSCGKLVCAKSGRLLCSGTSADARCPFKDYAYNAEIQSVKADYKADLAEETSSRESCFELRVGILPNSLVWQMPTQSCKLVGARKLPNHAFCRTSPGIWVETWWAHFQYLWNPLLGPGILAWTAALLKGEPGARHAQSVSKPEEWWQHGDV